ncbi:MAG: hypothetical protein FRX49_12756 [Trebouxia sp. A1-2]|nr:MAG: hypothetical protein FRX49_12756 [Trebouxia sp. A1-2]
MSDQIQMKALQQEIIDIAERLSDAKQALATAEQSGNGAEVVLQRKQVLQLGKQKCILLEQDNVLLKRFLGLDTVADTSSEEEVLIVTQDGEEVTATLHDGRLDLHALEKKLVKEGWWLSLLDGRIPSCDRNGLSRSKFKAGAVVHVEIKKKKGPTKTFEAYPGARSSWWPFNLFS